MLSKLDAGSPLTDVLASSLWNVVTEFCVNWLFFGSLWIPFQDGCTEELVFNPAVTRLTTLALGRAHLGDVGACAIVNSPYLGRLRVLNLSGNQITDAGAVAFAENTQMLYLRELYLDGNPLTAAGTHALLHSPRLRHLRMISLFGCPIADADRALTVERFGIDFMNRQHSR
jgi:hypothetical protein